MGKNQGDLDVRYHVLSDMVFRPHDAEDERFAERAAKDMEMRRKGRWFTSLGYAPPSGKVYCGQTQRDASFLHEFDPATGEFRDLGYKAISEDHEMKIHRGLWYDPERNSLYFGVASLSPIRNLVGSPGGRLIRYDIAAGEFEILGIPLAENYIQASVYDPERQLMYAFTEPTQSFAVWSIADKKLRRAHCMESIVHVTDLDDRGGVWGTYSHQHAFFRYDPDADRFEFPKGCVLPTAQRASGIMYLSAGPVDCCINGGNGKMLIGSALGELYELDPETYEIEYLGRPLPANRLPGLRVTEAGIIYGVGGDSNATTVFRYDRAARRFDILGKVQADDGKACYRPHDLVVTGDTLYVAETDTPKRCGYLWECRVR